MNEPELENNHPISDKRSVRVAVLCGGITLAMLGMSYAAVPLYKIFCQVTGYAGTTQRADDSSGDVLNRKITIRFDANTDSRLLWKFVPKQRDITLNIGAKAQIEYRAENVGRYGSSGTATFNVSPPQAGVYFNKIECFCFTEQHLAAGESMDMPVIFFIDPDIVNDELLKNVDAITLSYTFFEDEAARESDETAKVLKPAAKNIPSKSKL